MIGELRSARCFEYVGQPGVLPGEGEDEIDMVIGDELVGCFHEVEEADKEEFGLVFFELLFEL